MTVEVRLTPEQEAILVADAIRCEKSVADALLDRAFPPTNKADRRDEIERRIAVWGTIDRERAMRITPPTLRDVKMDAAFFYASE